MAEALRKRCGEFDQGVKLVIPGVYHPKNNKDNESSRNPKYSRPRYIHHNFQKYKTAYKRVVFKNGEFNIPRHHTTKKNSILTIWFVCMVMTRWRWTIINFTMAFILNWLFFGSLYWVIAMGHGDFSKHTELNGTEWTPCIRNIYNFTSSFLFSIEVDTTVAYGHRKITLACSAAVFVMCMQCISSSIFRSFMVGILFAKLTRPKARTQTIIFSKHAVVNSKDNKLCFMFRVGDIRTSRILNIKALMYIIRMDTDKDRLDEFEQVALNLELDGCESTFFLWPVSVIHVIDKNSPLYNISAADLLTGNIEILVVFEGIIESTGQPVQARSSYTSNEILWGHRFVQMVDYDAEKGMYNVDFSKLGVTEQIDTPLCSVSEYESVLAEIR